MLIPKLRMQFAEFLDANSSVAFAYSARPPVSVYGTVPWRRPLGVLSRHDGCARFHGPWPVSLAARLGARTSLGASPARGSDGDYHRPAASRPMLRPLVIARRCGDVDPLPVGYGSRPRLRGRLTLGQIAFTLETLGFRRTGIPPVFTLLMPASSLPPRPRGLTPPLHPYAECSPTDRTSCGPAASVARLAPLYYRRTTTRLVSCYALLGGVAASEPTSWLSVQSHFLSHLARIRDLGRRSGLFPSRRRPLSVAV